MQLLLNIGNTHIQVGTLEGRRPLLLHTCPTEEVVHGGSFPFLDTLADPWQALAVSVVPAAARILSLKYPSAIRFLTVKDFSMLDFTGIDTTTLGMDRIANAAAAYSLAKNAVTVIDFGTCINTVSVGKTGRFLGGAIMPGRMLLRKALRLYTAQLPMIPLGSESPSPLGTNTADALMAGTELGVLGAVRNLLEQTRRFTSPESPVYPAGGDAAFFQRHLPELSSPIPLLTLQGVALCL